jgi:hypothetical protein
MDWVADHDAIPRRLLRSRVGGLQPIACTIQRRHEILVIVEVMLFMEPSRQSEIRKLEVAVSVDKDIVRFNITTGFQI